MQIELELLEDAMNKLPETIEVTICEPTTIHLNMTSLRFAVISGYSSTRVYAIFYSLNRAKEHAKKNLTSGRIINIKTGEIISPTSKSNNP